MLGTSVECQRHCREHHCSFWTTWANQVPFRYQRHVQLPAWEGVRWHCCWIVDGDLLRRVWVETSVQATKLHRWASDTGIAAICTCEHTSHFRIVHLAGCDRSTPESFFTWNVHFMWFQRQINLSSYQMQRSTDLIGRQQPCVTAAEERGSWR